MTLSRRDGVWIVAGLIVAMCACLGGAIRSARAASPAPPSKNIWDGVYTDDQAARGKAQYNTSCSSCHMEDLSGSGQALPLAGDAFTDVWEGQTMADLLGLVQGTMPQDKPGSLTPEAALDVISYIVQYNKYPQRKRRTEERPGRAEEHPDYQESPAEDSIKWTRIWAPRRS